MFQQVTPSSGIQNQIEVDIPRLEADAVIDGVLDDSVWERAARLTDFSQYQPVDGRPAAEPTEVLVWYSANAIYFGVKATELHGDVVRATQANRDNIASEDQIQILLENIRTDRVEKEIGKIHCRADVRVGDATDGIVFTAQYNDDGDLYVEVSGFGDE